MPVAALAGIGIAGSIGGALIGSHAANSAAQTQADAANRAADLNYQASQNALDFQKQQWNTQQQNMAPWLQSGKQGVGQLDYLLGLGNPSQYSAAGTGAGVTNGFTPNGTATTGVNPSLGGFGSLMQPYTDKFVAPTELTMQNDPGYQARLKLGTDAMQRSAAARGGVLTGGTAQALNQFGQDYASNEYGNVYNRALNNYTTNYNVDQQNKANQFNRLASLSGMGQQTAAQLGQLGSQASNNVTSNLLNTAQNMGQQYNNAAAANASGIVGSANAWGGAINGIGNSLQNLYLMNQLAGGGHSSMQMPSDGGAWW